MYSCSGGGFAHGAGAVVVTDLGRARCRRGDACGVLPGWGLWRLLMRRLTAGTFVRGCVALFSGLRRVATSACALHAALPGGV